MMGYNSYTKAMLVNFSKKQKKPLGAKIVQTSVLLFAIWGFFWKVPAWKNTVGI